MENDKLVRAYPVKFTKKKNKAGKWQHRWFVPADNGRLIDCSSESFHDRQEAIDNAYRTYVSLKAMFESEEFSRHEMIKTEDVVRVLEKECVNLSGKVCNMKDPVCEDCKHIEYKNTP